MRESGNNEFTLPLFSEILHPDKQKEQSADEIIDGILDKLDSMGDKKMERG